MIYPDPGIETEPPPPPDEVSELDPTSLRSILRRNGMSMLLVVVITLTVLTAWVIKIQVRAPDDGLRLLLVELWVMAALMPAAAHRASRPLDALYRAEITDDAFGVFMVVLAFVGGQWSWFDAVKLYLLAMAVGLLLIGFLAALRCTDLPTVVTTALMAVAACCVAGFHTLSLVLPTELPGVLERINLLSAARDALGVRTAPVSWVVTFLVYGAAAGLCWSYLLIAGRLPPGEDDQDEESPAASDNDRPE
jgi:hypothetical protein